MTDVATGVNRPAWVDLSSPDPTASAAFYSKLFGWTAEVSPDPQYGGYIIEKLNGKDVAGIGGKQMPEQPTVWALYIGTRDAAALGEKVVSNGGSVIAPSFEIGDQGRMAVYADPTGAVISAWQPAVMGGFQQGGENTFGWAELNSRDLQRSIPFYENVFGWGKRHSESGDPGGYTEFLEGGESILGALAMNPMVPAQVPNYWGIYFNVDDVDAAFRKAIANGAQEQVAPQDFFGGRFAIVADPQGASFGLLKVS